MGTNVIIRNGLIAAIGVTGLTLSACATNSASGRYASVYDYESGGNCNNTACAPVAAPAYVEPVTLPAPVPVSTGVVYADCGTVDYMSCETNTYTPPAMAECPAGSVMSSNGTCVSSSYTSSHTTSYSSSSTTAECPAGTTKQPDGTCLQGGSSSYTSTTTSYTSGGTTTATVCPAGTTMQADGTCMQSSSYGGYTSTGGYTAKDFLPIRK